MLLLWVGLNANAQENSGAETLEQYIACLKKAQATETVSEQATAMY